MMNRTSTLITAAILAGTTLCCVADGMPPPPADYPSHRQVGECNRQHLRQQLQEYNEIRLALSDVLRHMAVDPAIQPSARDRLIGYAANLETMRTHLPPPDPDSAEFRNFDFQLGITLTAMTLFLNSEDPGLSRRFVADRDNPNSELGIYLTRLDDSRKHYMDELATSRQSDCHG